MANKIKFNCSVSPIEDNTNQFGGSNFIAASECYGSLTGSGEISGVTIDASGGATHGYDDSTIFYIQAAVGSTTAVSMAAADIVAVKNTGNAYSSATVLGAANTTDYLAVFIHDGAADRYVGTLKAGEMIVLPIRAKASMTVKVQSTDSDGDTNGSATLAAQVYSFT
tara:strand:- start:181 stop:681 length:501 start_codon:yes stop_codon:yes gene_type:complete